MMQPPAIPEIIQLIPLKVYLLLSTALFVIGIVGVLTRRNAIIIFMSIELIHLLFAAIYFTNTFFRCQISLTYSSMVLSDENLPEHAVLRMAILFHDLLSL